MTDFNELAAVTAYKIKTLVDTNFKNAPPEIQQQAMQIIMAHIQQMNSGQAVTLEGPDLVREVEEEKPQEPEPEPDK